MAISPAECTVVADEDAENLKNLERSIDDKLRKEFDPSSGRFVFFVPGGVRRQVINALIEKYEAVGWKVQYRSDQRDGAWLDFRA